MNDYFIDEKVLKDFRQSVQPQRELLNFPAEKVKKRDKSTNRRESSPIKKVTSIKIKCDETHSDSIFNQFLNGQFNYKKTYEELQNKEEN